MFAANIGNNNWRDHENRNLGFGLHGGADRGRHGAEPRGQVVLAFKRDGEHQIGAAKI